MTEEKSGKKIVGMAIAAIVVLAILFTLSLYGYRSEGENRAATVSDAGDKDPNHVEIFVKTVSADPIKGDMVIRLEFLPHGDLTNDDGATITRDLKFYVNSANGKREHDFAKGKRMSPMDVTLEMYEGEASDYPFDRHRAQLTLDINAPPAKEKSVEKKAEAPPADSEGVKKDESASGRTAAQAGNEEEAVPIAVDFFGSLHGFKVQATKTAESDADYVGVDIILSRASTSIFFSVFIMVAMWCLALAVLFLTLYVVTYRRKIELAMFSFMAALLFAFPALRNSQPGTPPIGTLSDFLAFFWAEVIIALSLLTILTLWLLRPTAK